MRMKQLLFKNMKKNIKNYSLYLFALVFSVALYFSFVTLQYDPAMDEMKGMVNGKATIQAGSFMLVFIVMIFLLYVNQLFMKRRGKEIGLYQLIGLTKGQIFRLLQIENVALYFSSIIVGIFVGFSISKLILMILFKLIDIEVMIALRFSSQAMLQTVLVFAIIYLFIMLANYIFIKKQSILTLFQIKSKAEARTHHLTLFTMISGIFGIACITFGYILSAKLFSGDFSGNGLLYAMLIILCLMMLGTYLFYKGSVTVVLYLIRKRRDGYLTINNVLSVAAMMFRMKSNALLLTIITLISALTITLASLAYISYHSAEKVAMQMVPDHFSLFNKSDLDLFTEGLTEQNIAYSVQEMDVLKVDVDLTEALEPGSYDNLDIKDDPRITLAMISDRTLNNVTVAENQAILTEPVAALGEMLTFKEAGEIMLTDVQSPTTLAYEEMSDMTVLPQRITDGFPVVIVNEKQFDRFKTEVDLPVLNEFSTYIGINMKRAKDTKAANELFADLNLFTWTGKWTGFESQLEISMYQKQGMGLSIFITGFLGVTFLITSGCILYFKQLDESEEEKGTFAILKKLGFTDADLLTGIRIKQGINFGIPLLIGLLHSYFAVKSGWFIFGTEMWTPMLIVMFIYTVLYSIFGFYSVQHYKHVLNEAL